jgi:hypothetical protein
MSREPLEPPIHQVIEIAGNAWLLGSLTKMYGDPDHEARLIRSFERESLERAAEEARQRETPQYKAWKTHKRREIICAQVSLLTKDLPREGFQVSGWPPEIHKSLCELHRVFWSIRSLLEPFDCFTWHPLVAAHFKSEQSKDVEHEPEQSKDVEHARAAFVSDDPLVAVFLESELHEDDEHTKAAFLSDEADTIFAPFEQKLMYEYFEGVGERLKEDILDGLRRQKIPFEPSDHAPEAVARGAASARTGTLEDRALALWLRRAQEGREPTFRELAAELGCNPKSLYRCKKLKNLIASHDRIDLPSGSRDAETRQIEAWANPGDDED